MRGKSIKAKHHRKSKQANRPQNNSRIKQIETNNVSKNQYIKRLLKTTYSILFVVISLIILINW